MGNQKSCLSPYLYCLKQDKDSSQLKNSNIYIDNMENENNVASEKAISLLCRESNKENINLSNSFSRNQKKSSEIDIDSVQTNQSNLLQSSILELKKNPTNLNVNYNDRNTEIMNCCQTNQFDCSNRQLVARLAFISRLRKLQKAIKAFLNMRTQQDSKFSLNNLSLALKVDRLAKSPPELYIKALNLMKDNRMSAANSEMNMNNKSINYRKSKPNVYESNYCNSASISKNLGLSCKFFKMNHDNSEILIIKKFIKKKMLCDVSKHFFGIKVYSNKSKILGFFNSAGEADGLAVYTCSNDITYKGKNLII